MSKEDIKKIILKLSFARGEDKTICPSEVAREIFGDNWRPEMQNVRDAAFDLAAKNLVIIMQKGKKVDPVDIKGPIRIRIQSSENND